MWQANPTWGSPRIVAELQKLGIDIAKSTVEKYRPKLHKPTSASWCTFLKQHMRDTVAIDFFTVPTARLRVLFVLVVLAHDRRRVVYFNVTEHPTAEWTAQQLVEAFAWESPPKCLLRDRDAIYANRFRKRLRGLGVKDRPSAPRSPWQNPYVERVIGSIRRECLDHVIVLNERHLETDSPWLFCLLPRMAPAPILGDRFTRRPTYPSTRTGRDNRVPNGPWTASLLPSERRMNFRDPQPC